MTIVMTPRASRTYDVHVGGVLRGSVSLYHDGWVAIDPDHRVVSGSHATADMAAAALPERRQW